MSSKRLAIVVLLALPLEMPSGVAHGAEGPTKAVSLKPRPELTPDQVIEFQLASLQFNDRPAKDAGIETAFRFASPNNRKMTGPIERFVLIVKNPAFRPLINHRIAGYGPVVVRGDVAVGRVTVVAADGLAVDYDFRLSKDPESGCWFTDGVIPIPPKLPIDPGKVARSSQISPSVSLESLLHLL